MAFGVFVPMEAGKQVWSHVRVASGSKIVVMFGMIESLSQQ